MPIYCDNCGFQNRDSAAFCKGCGGKIFSTTESGTLQTGIFLNKNYEIKNLIKSGGMGSVYLAIDHRFETYCAVKEMLSNTTSPKNEQYRINSFKREAKILHKLRHPNIPVVIDYFIEAGRYYLIMDYIEGKDLDVIRKEYPNNIVPEDTVVEWAKEILDALDYIHSQKPPMIYRDMKPSNIMIRTSDNKIILIDFGLARFIIPGSDSTKTIAGTPAFAPPELFSGKPEERTDIYSLGATMHCLLTGDISMIPFEFKPVRNYNPKVSKELEKIIIKALSKDLKDRYRSAKDMKEIITGLSVPVMVYINSGTFESSTLKQSKDIIEDKQEITTLTIPHNERVTKTSSTQALDICNKVKSYIEPEMVYIKGGNFQMGSNYGNDDEMPIHNVRVNDFYIGKYPVTNMEYERFKFKALVHIGWEIINANYPVVTISWYDAVLYCNWLSDQVGLPRCYSKSDVNVVIDIYKKGYRLPTEAEWEYACRSGSTTNYYWGNEIDNNYCWYCDNSKYQIHPVGQKKPNAWGLYDMAGNVWEWCSDWYGKYPSKTVINPIGNKKSSYMVCRGGYFGCISSCCRSAYRNRLNDSAYSEVGFRLVRSAL